LAGFAGIAAAGKSVERLLNACFDEEEPVPNRQTRAVLVRTNDFEKTIAEVNIGSPALSIFLYRADFNKTMRAAWSAVGSLDGNAHLAIDLHYLITPWADNAEFEHRILGRAMQALETTPVLSGPLLHASANWSPNESIQLITEDISTEAVMRIFDSLPTEYRLSVPYVARVVRIDSRQATPDMPATTIVTGAVPSSQL
jgi:hypothetical protein